MNRREMLRFSLAAALMGTATNPNEAQATQTVAAKPISLPELPPKPPKDNAPKLFPGFVQTEVRTSGASIPVLHKGDGPPLLLLQGYPENPRYLAQSSAKTRRAVLGLCTRSARIRGFKPPNRRRSPHQLLVPRNGVGPDRDDASFWARAVLCGLPRSGCSRRPSAVSRLSQKRHKGLSHGHRSDVDDVSTNQSRVCDEVHVVVLPYPSGVHARTFHWARSSVLSGSGHWRAKQDTRSYHTRSSERVPSMLLLHIDDPCLVRGFQSVC